jgi:hypothetical protein
MGKAFTYTQSGEAGYQTNPDQRPFSFSGILNE